MGMKFKEEPEDGIKMDVVKRERPDYDNDDNPIIFDAKSKQVNPDKIKKVAAQYDCVIVQDFGDEYHMSEDEKAAKFKYYEAFKLVRRCKRKYRKLDQYVSVFRLCLDCLDVVAQGNGLYEPDKFKKLFAQGKIKIYGLHFPRYVGRDKKDINWDYINEFIADRDRDPDELRSKKEENDFDYCDEDELESLRRQYFSPAQYDILFGEGDQNQEECDDNVVITYGRKKIQGMSEVFSELPKYIKEMKRDENDRNKTRGYEITIDEDDFKLFVDEEKKKGYYTDDEMPKFKGDIMNKDDYNRYLLKLHEWELEHTKMVYKGKTKSLGEIEELKLKDALEAAGWNVRNIYKNKNKEKKLRNQIKKEKKREEQIKKELIQIEKRKERRKNGDDDDDSLINTKEKKNKKHKSSKVHDHFRDEFEDDVLSAVDPDREYRDYSEYAEDMGDFTFSNIFGN